MYTLNHTALNWLKEFITLGVNGVLRHNLAQCAWLLYRVLDTLLQFYYYKLLALLLHNNCMLTKINVFISLMQFWPKTMHKPYKSDDISYKNTFGIEKVHSSKVESYLEVKAWTDWQQQDLISEYGQGAEHINTTLHTL